MRLIQPVIVWIVVAVLLAACGGGSTSASFDTTGSTGTQRTITKLANVGGAYNVTLSNGRIYFSNYNISGDIGSVAVTGGEITTHNSLSSGGIGQIAHIGGKIYAFENSTAGRLLAFPDTSIAMTRLSSTQQNSSSVVEVVNDGTYAYWSELDTSMTSHIVRVPLIPTGESPLSSQNLASTDILLTVSGIARIALEDGNLFVSEGSTGNIYKIDLATGNIIILATAIGPVSAYAFPLAAANGHLFAQVNTKSIVEVNETTGALTTIATSPSIMYSDQIRSDGIAVYWNERQGVNWVIRRYAPQNAQLTDVVSVPSVDMLYGWGIANNQVWWFIGPTTPTVYLQKAPVTGGATTTVATLSSGGWGIVGDATDLYWLENNQVMRMPQAGGSPVIVSRGSYFSPYKQIAITLTNSDIVWGGGSTYGIMKIPKTAYPIVDTVISQAVFPAMSLYMTADANTLYWATQNANSNTSDLFSWSPAGGTINTIGAINGTITRIFQHLNSLYFIRQRATGWTISVQPSTGGTETVLADSNSLMIEIRDAYVSNGVLYFTASDIIKGFGEVVTVDLATLTPTILVPNVRFPNRLYVDDSNVYWSTRNNSGIGGVFRTSLSGGAVETIYTGQGSWDIAGDANNIYWADGRAILRTNK